MRLASSKTMLFLNDSWMAQLGSESVSLKKTTSSGRLSAGGEAWSRSQTLCISQTRRKQQTGFAAGFYVWHWLALFGEVSSCWSGGHRAAASTKTHTSQFGRFEDSVETEAAIFKGSRLREAFLPSRRGQHANTSLPRGDLYSFTYVLAQNSFDLLQETSAAFALNAETICDPCGGCLMSPVPSVWPPVQPQSPTLSEAALPQKQHNPDQAQTICRWMSLHD